MEFKEYQKRTHDTAVYPEEKALDYLVLKLVSEVGEVAGHLGKYYRGDYDYVGASIQDILEHEIGDVQWYLSELCTHLGLDLGNIAEKNLEKLADRKERGVLKGSGDNR